MAKIFFAYPYQFDDEEPQYRVALRETCKEQKHEAVFANAVPAEHEIFQHVHECIADCDAAFVDITGLNPSVLIEFGMAHAAGKRKFVLLNELDHVKAGKSNWGRQSTEPLEIPANMNGTIRTPIRAPMTFAKI
jgi:Nucleoside 2-deoxyribosyltransferase